MFQITENGRLLNVGVIGIGGRGKGQLQLLCTMADLKVIGVCDKYEDRMRKAMEIAEGAAGYTDYKEMLKDERIDVVFIFSDWETHIPMAIDAMRAGKDVAMEVGGATSVQACWDMVHVSEETGRKCMMIENCSYNREEMALNRMVHENLFGRVVHCEGAYSHDLRSEIGNGDINRHYRMHNFLTRNGELYPTHELGPIMLYLNIGRGNRIVSLTSMSSCAAGLHEWFMEKRPDSEWVNAQINEGDIVTTMLKCANGETILLTHDCTLPRPYSRGGVIRGTKGMWMEAGSCITIEGRTKASNPESWNPHSFESASDYYQEFEHPLWKAYEEWGLRGGHGGMDYLVIRGFIEAVQNDTPLPIDVYDTALLMSITPLSEQSIALGSAPVEVPDFTCGGWMKKIDKKGEGIYAL